MNKSYLNKTSTIVVILALFSVSVVPSTGKDVEQYSISPLLDGKTLYVGGSGPGNYTRIQDAIDDASDGDTVYVYNGTYYENVVVDKSIDLVGEDKNNTIIDGNNIKDVIIINADNVKISCFTIRGSQLKWMYSGITVNTNNCWIHRNIIIDNEKGIWVKEGEHTRIFNNIFSNNNDSIRISENYNFIFNNTITNCQTGIDIHLKYSKVSGNIIKNAFDGIVLYDADFIEVHNNNISDCEYGIYVYRTSTNIIAHNIIKNNKFGIDIYVGSTLDEEKNVIHNNVISENTLVGIFLSITDRNEIYRNIIDSNGCGIYFAERAHNNQIYENNITDNKRIIQGGGIRIYDSLNNKFYRNNFINNSPNIRFWHRLWYTYLWDQEHQINTTWRQNYWDRPRELPYLILGRAGVLRGFIPWINIDWHPAKEPYDIGV